MPRHLFKAGCRTDKADIRHMSDGEKFIAQLLLLSVINEASGFGYIVIDNFDALDANNLEKVLNLITDPAFLSRYSNVLLAGVAHRDVQFDCRPPSDYCHSNLIRILNRSSVVPDSIPLE